MEKIAIISDVHGNLEALKTVLNDIKKRNINIIYCLGDTIAKGVHSSECIELIKKNCQVVLKGNTDDFFTKEHNLDKLNEKTKQRIIWNKSLLSKEDINYLKNLPFSHEFYMSGSLIRLFHATPNNIDGFCSNIDKLERKREMFLPSPLTPSQEIADIVIFGHIHIQWLERMYNRTIISTGSVGNPIEVVRSDNFNASNQETTKANYLIIEGNLNSKTYDSEISFQFIRIPYNQEKELNNNIPNPEKEAYTSEILYGKYRDPEKLIKSFKERQINVEIK